jgi:WhiB family redox-sensing transcriptional regulator
VGRRLQGAGTLSAQPLEDLPEVLPHERHTNFFEVPAEALPLYADLITASEDEELPCGQNGEYWYSSAAGDQLRAKLLCKSCPVLNECRAYVLAAGEPFGVWGALTPKERLNP